MSAPFVISARWRAKPGCENRVREILEEMTAHSRAEEGCLVYQAHRSTEDPRLFVMYEQYADEPAFATHAQSEYFTRLVMHEAIPELLEHREREALEAI